MRKILQEDLIKYLTGNKSKRIANQIEGFSGVMARAQFLDAWYASG
ncbi:MAG: hypothetical protein KDD38_01620 [Bdellovibrionales bacterium]|nr:hypothetical protein [Bdellovibrionales bacterium]